MGRHQRADLAVAGKIIHGVRDWTGRVRFRTPFLFERLRLQTLFYHATEFISVVPALLHYGNALQIA